MSLPERIGRYRVVGEMGRGAMGVVYRARDEGLDRDVAIKVMTKGVTEAGARARFQREARAAAKLQHPNIIVVYELGEHEGAPFMVLELLEGTDLQRAIEGGIRPDPRGTVPVVLQVLAGLGHAHEHGIVHRDVKPSNIFLPVSRPAKIMDFGVARLSGVGTTTTGAISGTPSYMSPEQVSGGEVDGRSDLFSVGLILYELVTGERAIRGDSVVALMYKILHETADLSLIPAGLQWQRLHAVLSRSLARQPEDRYPDAASMSADLAAALSDLGGTVDWTAPADQGVLVSRRAPTPVAVTPTPAARSKEVPPAPPTPRSAVRRRGPLLLVGGLAGAVLLGVLAVGLKDSMSQRPEPIPSPTLDPGPGAAKAASPLTSVSATAAGQKSPASSPTPAVPSTPTPGVPPPPAEGTSVAGSASPQATDGGATPGPAKTTTPPVAGTPEVRLQRAREALQRGRWAEALAESRAVLETTPTSAEAASVAQRAEAEVVVEECLRNAGAALREGDRDRALDEIRRGFLIRPNDPRLLELHRQAVQQ